MNLLDQLRDTADALTEPHQHTERVAYWDRNRHKKFRTHTTTQPGLLAQLYDAVMPGDSQAGDGGHSVPGSRPPLALEALSRHTVIVIAVTRWCWSLKVDIRDTAESSIRALLGAAPTLDEDTVKTLLAEMRQWRRWCAVLTGWEQLYQPAGIPCPIPDCNQVNTLRINLTSATAMCRACGAAWDQDDGSISILADYIRSTTGEAA